tara:strand:+ start:231258 stop:231692 length:435 start_codon:yes stop_codon:yes gene_type:complete
MSDIQQLDIIFLFSILFCALWGVIIVCRFLRFFVTLGYYWCKGETERRVIRHWFKGSKRVAPVGKLTPFCLSYEIEREHFWINVKAGNSPQKQPLITLPEGTFPSFALIPEKATFLIYSDPRDLVACGAFQKQVRSLKKIKLVS